MCVLCHSVAHQVGARDGLQNEKQVISTDVKVEFIRKCVLMPNLSRRQACSIA